MYLTFSLSLARRLYLVDGIVVVVAFVTLDEHNDNLTVSTRVARRKMNKSETRKNPYDLYEKSEESISLCVENSISFGI